MKKNGFTEERARNLMKLEGLDEMMVDGIDLIPVYVTDTGERVVDGRELHRGVMSRQDFSTWVKKRLTECDAEENEDFARFHKKMEANNATLTEYIIKLDTAKEMAMLERNEIGKKVRKYFILVENKAKESAIQAQKLSPMLQVMINLELEQKQQSEKLAALEEKTDKQAETVQTVKDALIHDISENGFIQWVNTAVRKIAQSPALPCLNDSMRYSTAWTESYERLNRKRACRLKQRVERAKSDAAIAGATKTQINSINNLTVIAADCNLRPVYESVIREMMIAYCVE